MKIIILTLFGILAGLLSSLLGQSPAIIILPILLLFKIVKNYKVAVGTTIFIVFLSTFSSLLVHLQNENINIKVALYLSLITVISSYISAHYLKHMQKNDLSKSTIILYIFLLLLWVFIFYKNS
jgi:uncharacterized membrane protein YfcA